MQSKVSLARSGGSRQQADWTLFLIPNRVAIVTSAAYVSVPIFFWVYNVYAAHSTDPMLLWKEATIIGVTLLLLSIDRLEYWHFGDITPAGTAAALLITRILFIEIIAQLDSFKFCFTVPDPAADCCTLFWRLGWLRSGGARLDRLCRQAHAEYPRVAE